MKLKIEEKVTLRITWKKPLCTGQHGIKGYFIYYGIKGKGYTKTPLLKCCEHKIEKLQEGADYKVYMVAVDGQNREGDRSMSESAMAGGKL